MEHNEEFQKLNIRVVDIPEEHNIDFFIGTLQDNIQYEVCFWKTHSLEKVFRLEKKIECKIMSTMKPANHIYNDGSVSTCVIPQPTRLTPQ